MMEDLEMEITVESIVAIIALVAGVLGYPLTGLIKRALKALGLDASSKATFGVATVISIGLGFVVVLVSGQFTGVELTLENVGLMSTAVFSVSQIVYKAMQSDKIG